MKFLYRNGQLFFWIAYFLFFILTSDFKGWRSVIYWSIFTGCSYINTYSFNRYAIPVLLNRGKNVHFFLFAFTISLAGAVLTCMGYVFLLTDFRSFTWNEEVSANLIGPFTLIASVNAFFSIFKVNSMKKKMEKKNALLKAERMESELQFLRAQFNPHFLFNVINNIYFLIEQNPVLARNTLLKFSETLRYQLYECTSESIRIENELQYLKNYIEIEKVRAGDKLTVSFESHENIKNHTIAPFLFIPFIENAFKYVSVNTENQNYIDIKLFMDNDHYFVFEQSNTVNTLKSNYKINAGSSGIGLKNVKRRLELLYKDRYKLTIAETASLYKVVLKIKVDLSSLEADANNMRLTNYGINFDEKTTTVT